MPPNHPKPQRRASDLVLIVDDYQPLRAMLLRMLSSESIRARGCPSALHAQRFLERTEVSVIVSDYKMAGPDGGQLLAMVRDRWPATRRILLTGNPWGVSDEAKAAAHRVVGKGAAVDEALDAIREELEVWRAG